MRTAFALFAALLGAWLSPSGRISRSGRSRRSGARGSLLRRRWGCGLGKAFARFDGGGVPRDVADQAVLLGLADEGLMHKLAQFHLRELRKRSRERRFARYLPGRFPAANPPQLRVPLQSVQQLPRETEPIHRLGDKSGGDGQPVFGWAAHPAPRAGNKARQRNHLQGGDQSLGGLSQLTELLFQGREQGRLQHVTELRELLP